MNNRESKKQSRVKISDFSIIKRAKSFAHAGRGIYLLFKTTPNAWIHILVLIFVVLLGLFCQISHVEWIILIMCGGAVITAETFNTAIEVDIDLTSPDYHPYARDTKDLAAAAVLISAIVAVIVGCFIFIPYFIL